MSEKDYGPRIGADPEVFVTTAGEIVPVCGKIGGTKQKPLIISAQIKEHYGEEIHEDILRRVGRRNVDREDDPLKIIGDYAVQEDNVMLEFNIPACPTYDGFRRSIEKMHDYLTNWLRDTKQLGISWGRPECQFQREELEKFPQALQIGCMSDYYAYGPKNNLKREPFKPEQFGNMRFCGGHIHLQYNQNNVPDYVMAQFMDLVAALPFLEFDKQRARRLFYGQPGIFRKKEYGIEYRTLSNFWLADEFRTKLLGSLADNVLELGRKANENPEFLNNLYGKIPWEEVQTAIRNEDIKKGKEIVGEARLMGLLINTKNG